MTTSNPKDDYDVCWNDERLISGEELKRILRGRVRELGIRNVARLFGLSTHAIRRNLARRVDPQIKVLFGVVQNVGLTWGLHAIKDCKAR